MSDTYGRYAVVDKVGQGGMSVVYRARDPALDRVVALKVMHPHLAERAEARARFSREARAVARLRHPHIVEVYDYAPPESERAYIVTEFIDGPTLRGFAEAHPQRHPETAALLMLPIVEALARAHEGGVVHRDVKPENIMLRPGGAPVLMDFGIAQMVESETLTATGTVLGSPAHMAPEVVDGHAIGPPADVFSVGTVLYWLVCDALPFSGPNPSALFRRILEGRFDPVQQRRPHAGRPIARLIEECLETDPAARPTAAALAESLRTILADAGLVDLPVERARYVADPAVYEDELGRALVPRLVTQARQAVDARRTAAALDLLDRALWLDENHPEAQALLERLERGQRLGQRVRVAAALLLFGGLVGGAIWAGSAWIDAQPIDEADVGALTSAGGDAQPAEVPPDADPADAASPLDAQLDGALDADPDGALDAAPDARRVAARRRTRQRPPPPPAPDAGRPLPTRATVEVHGQHKGAEVFVDGVRQGYLYKIEGAGGLVLGVGRHPIRFTNPGCADQLEVVTVKPGQKRAPPLEFVCRPRPATLRIVGPPDLEVRRSDDGTQLGRTNQDIRVPMTVLEARLGLTIGAPGDSFDRQMVTLNAGQRTVVRVADRPR